jgi:hypothetical protein
MIVIMKVLGRMGDFSFMIMELGPAARGFGYPLVVSKGNEVS